MPITLSYAADFRTFIEQNADPASVPPPGYTGSPRPHRGIAVPKLRAFLRTWIAQHKTLTVDEFIATLDELYSGESYEERIAAGYLLGSYNKLRQQIPFDTFFDWLGHLEGWAEVDSTCQSNFAGKELIARWGEWESFLRRLCADANTNRRRASLVLLLRTLREADDPRVIRLALDLVHANKHDKDKRITKAISWVLRDGIKHHRAAIEQTVAEHVNTLPKIALREVAKKLETGKKSSKRQPEP
jgi:3-methyladenine DNA glycosylase AlkD